MSKLVFGVVALATLGAGDSALRSPPICGPGPRTVYKSAPVTPYYNWTGCYRRRQRRRRLVPTRASSDPTGVYCPAFPRPGSAAWHSAGGFAGGAQVGCDYQIGSWVIGGQGMFDWADLKGDNQQPGECDSSTRRHVPWVTTATGRLGDTVLPNLLLYAKGGGAWVKDNYTMLHARPGVRACHFGMAGRAPAGPSAPASNSCSPAAGPGLPSTTISTSAPTPRRSTRMSCRPSSTRSMSSRTICTWSSLA